MRKLLTPGKLAVAGAVLLGAVFGVLLLAPTSGTYIFLPDEAHPVEPLVRVEGEKDLADGGGIYFVDVIVRKATLLERVFPGIREGSSLVPAHVLNPVGVSDEERRRENQRAMTQSQRVAAAVALRTLGHPAQIRLGGVEVERVLRGLPASGRLRRGDRIVSVGGRRIGSVCSLQRAVSGAPQGASVTLAVARGGATRTVRIRPHREESGRRVLGILASPDARVGKLPLDVKIDVGNVGGPSAGLAFALDVLEELGRDVDRGHRVAVTGTIEPDGCVGEIGGIKQKTIGARRADVDVFVVPAGDNARDAREHAAGLRIIAVESFQQALQKLATLPRSQQD